MSYHDPNQYQQGAPQQNYPAQQYQQNYPPPPPPQQGQHHQQHGQYAQQQHGQHTQAQYGAGQLSQGNTQTGYGSGQPSHGSGAFHATDSGTFQGGSYQISQRDINSILTIKLAQGGSVKSRAGAMFEMAGTIILQGKSKGLKKLFTGGDMYESVYTGHGELCLAPPLLGDLAAIKLDGSQQWYLGKDAYLAATIDVSKKIKSQGIGKALFSGEDLFVYQLVGTGVVWVSSFGAITRRDIPAGQSHIVDNGHLVAWNCEYKIEKAGGGVFTSMKTGEGAVCRFHGPGTVLIQTRNFEDFAAAVVTEAGVRSS